MITSLFVTTAYYILSFIIELFPVSAGFPSEVPSAFQYLGGYVGMLDPLIPVDTLLTAVSILLVVELGILSFRILSWLIGKIPFMKSSK